MKNLTLMMLLIGLISSCSSRMGDHFEVVGDREILSCIKIMDETYQCSSKKARTGTVEKDNTTPFVVRERI